MAFEDDGADYSEIARRVVGALLPLGVSAIGVNCGFGPSPTLNVARSLLEAGAPLVSAMPNAGLATAVGDRRPVRIVLHIARRLAGVIGTRGLVRIISPIGLRLSRIPRSVRPFRIILHVARRLADVVVGSTRPVGIILIIPRLLPLAISLVVLPLAGPVIALAVWRRPGRDGRRHSNV